VRRREQAALEGAAQHQRFRLVRPEAKRRREQAALGETPP